MQQCSTEWACTSFERADHLVFRLAESRDYLTAMLNDALSSTHATEVNRLVELHSIISQLMVMWETALEQLERTTEGGRPRKYVNIPLVRSVF